MAGEPVDFEKLFGGAGSPELQELFAFLKGDGERRADAAAGTFAFTDGGSPCTLVFGGDGLVFSRAALTRTIPWAALRHLYRHHTARRESDGYERLVLGFDDVRGRKRHLMINAPPGDPELARAVAALVAAKPEIDRCSLAPDVAYRQIGVATDRPFVITGAIVVALATIVTAAPSFARLARGSEGYLTVPAAHADLTNRLETHEKSGAMEAVTDSYVPLVTASSAAGCAPTVYLHFGRWTAETSGLASQSSFSGGREMFWDDDATSLAGFEARRWPEGDTCAAHAEGEVALIDPTATSSTDVRRGVGTVLLGLALGGGLLLLDALRRRWRAVASARSATAYRG